MRQRRKHRDPGQATTSRTSANVQTTLRLPSPLYERAKDFVKRGNSRSLNDFIVSALAAYVRAKERRVIDDAFRPMKDDAEYQHEALMITEEFAGSDAEVASIAERDLVDA